MTAEQATAPTTGAPGGRGGGRGGGGGREGVPFPSRPQNPFNADEEEDPFQPHFNHEHELRQQQHHQPFIDITSDSYSPAPPVVANNNNNNAKNPFADESGEPERRGRGHAKGEADYDSFESDTEEDNYGDSMSDYTSSSSSDDGFGTDSDDGDGGHGSLKKKRAAGALADTSYREPEDGDDDDEQEDTQQLLLSSNNTKMGGMGMGMRVGETGTGTMIGLDLEPHGDGRAFGFGHGQQKDEYDTLPLSTVNSRGRRKHRRRHRQRKEDGDIHEEYEGDDDDEADETGRVGRSGKRKSRGSKKKRRRDGRTGAGSAVAGDGGDTPILGLGAIRAEQVAAIAKKQARVQMAWNAFYVFAWYSCSTALSFYNKWLFSPQHHNFQFPLFTTSLHMVAQFALSSLTLFLLPAMRPKASPSPKDFGTKIVPCAVASGLDIGLSNSSLKTITLAFYTMCKSSSLAFVLLFAFLFRLERPTWTLAGVIGVICVGLFMMVMSEVDFVLIGFIQVMAAAVLGGLRWSLTQMLLERTDTKSGSLANPISTIFFLSPIMGVCLCIVAGIFEGFGTIFGSPFFATAGSAMGTLGLLFLGGVFAFMMVLAEFNLIARTSVVTLSVLGIVKEVVTIVISSLVFHDHLTLVNIMGLFVTLTGIGFYHFMKLRQMKSKARRAAKELADTELANAATKKERALERQRRREEKHARRQGDHGSAGGLGLKMTGGTSDPSLEDDEVDNPFKDRRGIRGGGGEEELPWNHSLPSGATLQKQQSQRQQEEDAFVLDDDEVIVVGSRGGGT
ncbi:Triose-phosphate Transporter [Mortierella hygrophila]|uniref:Triose-phosphate Transporter n=1 Tax=Mortierella hygrophila TaxID=979708 RepID=A0A9P6EZJ3_9FUNG|nr:Triose-phosphate Transporter [Mortierella hygrophila]